MSMTIAQAVKWHRQQGHAILIPTPPACERLLGLARSEQITVGKLYVVTQPLEAGCSGSYDRATGDLWCVYDANKGEEGQREVLRTLLFLLARVQLKFPRAQSITQDWEQVRQAVERAYLLAQRWRQETLFTQADLSALLTQTVRLGFAHYAAGKLAGHPSPGVARQAYLALQTYQFCDPELATEDAFWDALLSVNAERIGTDLVDFDRSLLRARWLATSTRAAGVPASFGAHTLPLSLVSARLLRSALAQAMNVEPKPAPAHVSVWYRIIGEERDLVESIHLLNTWLIDQFPHAAVRLTGWVYGDAVSKTGGAGHLYRVRVCYEDLPDHERVGAVYEAWFLLPSRHKLRQRALECAWQRFLRSWLTWGELLSDDLTTGLLTLWSVLEPQG